MVYQHLFYQRSCKEIASQLFVSPQTVQRVWDIFVNSGNVSPCRVGRPKGSVSLLPHEEYIIMDSILQKPQTQLSEIATQIANTTGSVFGEETLCKTIHRLGLTRKKVINESLQLCYEMLIGVLKYLSYIHYK